MFHLIPTPPVTSPFLCLLLSLTLLLPSQALTNQNPLLTPAPTSLSVTAQSAVLLEQSTGTLLYEKEAHTPLPPASITKIMTLLLVMDALDSQRISLQELVIVSANAASMGGSQVYLKAGETMEVQELLKCVTVVSANDASVALAEHLSGSEALFVAQMNQKAQDLGMVNTLFQNCTGLPAEHHLSTAYDIALMSQALLETHPQITQLSTIWMDSIRNGDFDLSNTNRLIYDYPGATGLKTGSTDEALYCLSASATRDNLNLIAVVLKSPSSQDRFQDATSLLDYGFAHFQLQDAFPSSPIPPIPVILGTKSAVQGQISAPSQILLGKDQQLTTSLQLPPSLTAPVAQGSQIGTFDVFLDDNFYQSFPIYACEQVSKQSILEIFDTLFRILVMS